MKDLARDNPEYRRYINSPEWRRRADARMSLDNGICQVCGKPATEVHHLTYRNIHKELPEDLVSLCNTCHCKAEELYDPALTPWEIGGAGRNNNFMAAMRADAASVARMVWEHIRHERGMDFDSMMSLRQPSDPEGNRYWATLGNAVRALCGKRYSLNCECDRTDVMLSAIENRVRSICLSAIEHQIRNKVQGELHDLAVTEHMVLEKWKRVSDYLGIREGTLQKLRCDDGTSSGPSLRETVLYYCALDASAGVRPLEGFKCLTREDYMQLNGLADYMISVSGTGAFKGEYEGEIDHA
jgi:hypothetical protein